MRPPTHGRNDRSLALVSSASLQTTTHGLPRRRRANNTPKKHPNDDLITPTRCREPCGLLPYPAAHAPARPDPEPAEDIVDETMETSRHDPTPQTHPSPCMQRRRMTAPNQANAGTRAHHHLQSRSSSCSRPSAMCHATALSLSLSGLANGVSSLGGHVPRGHHDIVSGRFRQRSSPVCWTSVLRLSRV
jgi:hypothetical protein